MKIHFYGTGASEGFPAVFCECEACRQARIRGGKNIRTRTSLQIDDNLLIDFSPDTYAHTLYGGLDLTKVEYLLITHSHPDHLYAMDVANVLPPMGKRKTERKLQVYGNENVTKIMNRTLQNCSKAREYICCKEIHAFEDFAIQEYHVFPVKANHMQEEECLLYVIQKAGKTVLVGFDTAEFPEETWQALTPYHFDCVILDCTSVDKDSYFRGHMGFGENVMIKKRMLREQMAGENTIFIATHFAHSFTPLHERLSDLFAPEGFLPAYDGMEVRF
ncbi:MAG: hypothetical protein KHZ58_02555 [Hungatella hathewayi]|nr:hypothetical protein [Hungatella hathewayi]